MSDSTRLFIGGLHHDVRVSDIEARLSSFGAVRDVEISHRTSDPHASFCHATLLASAAQARQCVRALHRSKWRGGALRVEIASSPRFDERLRIERETPIVSDSDDDAASAQGALLRPVENERGWQKVKGRLMPRLTIAGPYKGAPSVREVPEQLITRLKFLSDGPLAPKSRELSIVELHSALNGDNAADDERRRERQRVAQREHELRIVEINAKRQLSSARQELRKRNRETKEAPVAVLDDDADDTSGSASESYHGEAIPVDLNDVDDDSFEAVDEEASVDDAAAARARFQEPNFVDDDDDDDDGDLGAFLKKARKNPLPPPVRDEEGPASPPPSPQRVAPTRAAASQPVKPVKPVAPVEPTPPKVGVQVNVPRLRSLFFNVADSDPLFAASDQGVLRRTTSVATETTKDDSDDNGDGDDVHDDDDDHDNTGEPVSNALDEEEEYEARPISAALDAGKFSLMPAATTDSFLATLFEGPTKSATAEAAPTKTAQPTSSQPQRVFRLFAPNSANDSSAISPAMQARQSSQPVAGIKSKALLGQLDRKAKKEQQKAQQQKTIDVQSATITKPKPLFDIAAMLAPLSSKKERKKKKK